MMRFNFENLNEEDVPPGGEFFDPFEIKFFKKRKGFDFSFLETEPVANFIWSTQKLSPQLNRDKQKKLQDKISKLLSDSEVQEEEIEDNPSVKSGDANAQYKKILIVAEKKLN